VYFSKDKLGQMAWHMAAEGIHIELLETLWDFAKELQLKAEELRNQLWLSKEKSGKTARHIAAGESHVEVLKRLWDWAKILQLKPVDLRNHVC